MMLRNFDQLYDEYAADVYRFALYLCGSTEWAEDLTSEAFVRAFTRRNSLRMPTVRAYLLSIVRNLYRTQVRREARFSELSEYVPSEAPGPQACAEQQHELQVLLRGLQSLSEHNRAALLMHTLNDMPYQEIAAVLGISQAAARVRVHRARLKLVEFRNRKMEGGYRDESDS